LLSEGNCNVEFVNNENEEADVKMLLFLFDSLSSRSLNTYTRPPRYFDTNSPRVDEIRTVDYSVDVADCELALLPPSFGHSREVVRADTRGVTYQYLVQLETNRLLFRSAAPHVNRTYSRTEQRHISPANKLIPPPTPKRKNIGRENRIAPAARQLRAAALAANSEAAYLGWIFGM
jgi:hypothetical protein